MKKKTKIILFSIIGFIVILAIGKAAGAFGQKEDIKVSVEPATRRTITEIITANGKIQPETEVRISSDVSGEIVELHVKEGDEVKAGDLLIKIKPDIYLSNLDRMTASVNSSKANLANSKARLSQIKAQFEKSKLDYEREKGLLKEGAITQVQYEQSYTNFLSSKAEVEAAEQTVNASLYSIKSSEASLKEARENLNKTTIYAPMSGTVSMLNVEKGERVVGTMQMTGTELLRIANLNKMEVIVEVNENDIVKVHHNDTAIIEVDAYFEKEFKGVVTEIANSAQNTGLQQVSVDQVTNFEVKILVLKESYQDLIPEDDPNHYPFRPGMSATVDIQSKTVGDALSIPIQSVTTRSDSAMVQRFKRKSERKKEDKEKEKNKDNKNGTEKKKKEKEEELKVVVFILNKDNTVSMKEVKTGIQDNDYIQITEGITDSIEVVSAPYSAITKKLKDGQKVTKTEKEKLYGEE